MPYLKSSPLKVHLLLSVYLALILGVVIFFDYWDAILLQWPILLGTSVFGIILIALCGLIAKKWTFLIYALLFTVALIVARITVTSPVKTFKLLHSRLQPGLQKALVLDLLYSYFPEDGRYKQPSKWAPEENSMVLTLDSNNARYDSEVIVITFDEERIKKTVYYPD